MSGPVPPELGRLTRLRVLALDDNALSGPVPPELGALENLEELSLRGNRLSGEVPSELANLANLSLLRLAGNDFLDTVLPALYDVPNHDLNQELLCLPSPQLGKGLLVDCEGLLAARGSLAGTAVLDWRRSRPISTWQGVKLGGAPVRVVEVDLTAAGLAGRIPPQLEELDQLVSLRLNDNRLSGPVPPELGALENLEELSLRGNRLSGAVPSELADLTNLSLLRLAGNDFSDTLPPALYDVASHDLERSLHCPASSRSNTGLINDCVVLLEVRDNLAGDFALDWNDAVPIEFWQGVTVAGTPARVTELSLPALGLSGIVPAALSELDRLVKLNLVGNALTGPIPPDLGRLIHIRELLLGGNALSGSIPSQLGGLDQLTLLHLYENRLSGPIPPELGKLRSLLGLSLASNRLIGSIPSELGRLANLRWLNLRFNRLTGSVRPTLRRLINLESIHFSHNDFSDAPPRDAGSDEVDPGHGIDRAPPARTPRQTDPGLSADRAVLLAARNALAGAASLNWSDSTPLYFWDGVMLSGTPARVTALNLPERGLSGRIPPALGGLDQLAALRLHRNRLTGAIPPELGRLTELRELALGSNALSGPIPPQLGDLEQLTVLHLRRNRLTGPIPTELARLAKLRTLALDSNALSGVVPRELAKLPNLEELRLAGNRLDLPLELAAFSEPPASSPDGSLAVDSTVRRVGLDLFCPDADAQADELAGDCAALLAARDALAGERKLNWNRAVPISAWQGVRLGGQPPRVFAVNLSRAGLTGAIPAELGRLETLVWLDLDGNTLTGSIPAELGMLANLRRLALGGNDLTGFIPPQLGNLSNLEELRLGGNEFTGCLPWELQDIADRELALDLLCAPSMGSGRGLREDAIALIEMRDILAGSTKLNWSYATPIASWEGVTVNPVRSVDRGAQEGGTARGTERAVGLDLSGMALNGRLPAALGNLEKLIWLRLNDNRLSGAIPPELGRLADLRELGLESNALTGPIPPQLGQLANLSELWLGHNRLSGAIPPELSALDALSVLHLRGNEFTGCIPTLGKMANQFRARPDGLPKCDATPDNGFSTLGDAIKRINAAVDPSTPGGIPRSAHNLYLQVGVQTGVFGLGALALLCASLIFNLRVRTSAQVTPVHCYAAACTIAVLVQNTFDVYLLQNVFAVACVEWILIGLGAGVVNARLCAPHRQAANLPAAA